MNFGHADLPESLERLEDGSIRVTGHRVSLYHILNALYETDDAAEISDRYPTIPMAVLDQVLDFCRQHPVDLRQFHQEQNAAAESLRRSLTHDGPTRAALLARMPRSAPVIDASATHP